MAGSVKYGDKKALIMEINPILWKNNQFKTLENIWEISYQHKHNKSGGFFPEN